MRELLHTSHFIVLEDEAARILTRSRSAERFVSLEQMETEYSGLVAALDRVDRTLYGILVDLRQAPPRNDDAFETLVGRYQTALYGRFRRVAIVVSTAAGRLQVRRFMSAFRPDARLFTDVDEAMTFLRA